MHDHEKVGGVSRCHRCITMAQVLADEEDNIRVNAVNPGRTRTAMRKKAYPGEDPGTLPAPDEVLPAYVYLMSPDSKGVSGQSFDCQ